MIRARRLGLTWALALVLEPLEGPRKGAGAAGDVDRVRVSGFEEERAEGVRDDGRADGVGGEGGEVARVDVVAGVAGGDAGVVDEAVEMAVCGGDEGGGSLDGGWDSHVEFEGDKAGWAGGVGGLD